MTKLQPPVGTKIETREDAIRILLSPEYLEFTYKAFDKQLQNSKGLHVQIRDIVYSANLPYTVTGVIDDFTEDPNFSMHPRVEQITIKAGEMSWEEWQPHFERMLGGDLRRLTVAPDVALDKNTSVLYFGDLCSDSLFPITFKQHFTYTPVYPAKVSEPETVEETPSEAEPQEEPLPYKFAVFPRDADCFEDFPYRLEKTFEKAYEAAQAESRGTGEDINIVVATFRAERLVNVTERTF